MRWAVVRVHREARKMREAVETGHILERRPLDRWGGGWRSAFHGLHAGDVLPRKRKKSSSGTGENEKREEGENGEKEKERSKKKEAQG